MLTVLKPAEIEVVSLPEVKAHLRLDHSFEDDYLLTIIQAATQNVESYLGKSLISRTWQLMWQPDKSEKGGLVEIKLPYPPLMEIISVNKIFQGDRKQPMKRYGLETMSSMPKLICVADSEAVEVIYRSGYGDYPKSIPAGIRQALLVRIADFYENRCSASFESKSTLDSLFKELLAPHRLVGLT
ncbi:head-tail connector protein [Candidatus Finniella inopinata]|uniref:Phage gp6-like head-tail connector protein n=1 Tax=Candidatus Finniella inopinata TaxID=1696036 RepID=A0A4Q7DKG4_9PROT|nr:head-tail connector protein [Candidatus Finniella inopinata]RZI46574.1 hypothetical protein EQU50_03020 [Candidatus Finniella inopinata]